MKSLHSCCPVKNNYLLFHSIILTTFSNYENGKKNRVIMRNALHILKSKWQNLIEN